ncbi:MAG TPA: hypothetical protein VN844_11515 [Pyrinomonadaceae bacterium]|nr:hypothetical protein [Pyrinomonadaceae bacterium]
MKQFLMSIALSVAASSIVVGYQSQSAEGLSIAPETTPAYTVLVLRKAAVEAELARLSETFTSEHPSVGSKRFELHAITLEMKKMLAIAQPQTGKLSSSVGRLVLSKVALEVELNDLLSNFTSDHPDVRKKRIELAALEREIDKILR